MEAKDYLALAFEYLNIAKHNQEEKKFLRGAIDTAYNAAELCVKGLLILKLDRIPSTHGGVVQKFGQIYVKSGILERAVGRKLNQALMHRNKARYDRYAKFNKKDGQEIISLADELAKVLKQEAESAKR